MRFYINNIVSDYYSNSDIAPRFTYRTIDIENIELAGGNYTLNLKLPKTYINCQTFGFINRIEKETTYWYNKTYTARVELDGNTIFEGTLTVDSITDKDFECTLIGNNIDWSSQLNRSLRDIESFDRPLWSAVRSTLYNPFPQQYANSVGYRDYWLDTLGVNSLFETDGLEFALPLISYGNFPAPIGFNDPSIPIDSTFAAGENKWALYNTQNDPLNWGSIFPCPYMKSTVLNIFKDLNYTVAGDFINNDKYNNIIIPFTSADQPPWNWGLLHRVNIDWTQIPSSILTYNGYSFQQTQPNSQTRWNPKKPGLLKDIYIKLFAANDPMPTSVNINERYMFQDSYRFSGVDYLSNRDCFVAQTDGTFRVTWNIKEFGSIDSNIFIDTDRWYQPGSASPGFYFMIVKRGKLNSPTESVLGDSGNGLVDYLNYTILDNQVVASQFFDVQSGLYNNLDTTTIDINLTADIILEKFDTLELMIAFIDVTENAGPIGVVVPQYITLNVGSTSNLTVEPLNLPIELNPAKFLPDFTQRDFLRSILNMYNLFLYFDKDTNTIWINEFENYFLPSSAQLDWSDKASLDDESVVIKPGFTYREVSLKLTPDDNDIYELVDNIPTDATIENLNNYWNETKTIELLHSFTSMRNYYVTGDTLYYAEGVGSITDTTMTITSMVSAELFQVGDILTGPNITTNTKILQILTGTGGVGTFELDTNQTVASQTIVTVPSAKVELENIPIPTMSTEEVYEATGYELYTGSVIRSYDFNMRLLKYLGMIRFGQLVTPPVFKNLWIEDTGFTQFGYFTLPSAVQEDTTSEFNPRFVGDNSLLPAWKKWIALVNKALSVSLNAYLTASDIAQLDIRKPIRIGSETFIISSIEEYNPVELTTTKIKLYKK